MTGRVESPIEHLERLSMPEPNSGCTLWLGKVDARHGYGLVIHRRTHYRAHRFAYESYVGPIDTGLVIDHLCRNRTCINPSHMEPVSIATNTMRGSGPSAMNAQRTTCVNGHAFDEANTRVSSRGTSTRRTCRACARQAFHQGKARRLGVPGAGR